MVEKSVATGPHVLRRMNVAAVLAELRHRAPRAARVSEVAAATGLSRPAVTRALSRLQDRGLVEPTVGGSGEGPQVGRPAQALRFRSELGHVAGIDIGPHKVLVIVADLAGQVLASRREDVRPAITGTDLYALVESALLGAVQDIGGSVRQLWAVSVGTPGVVDSERGEVVLAPSIPGWAGVPTVARLRERLKCPVHIENDVNLAVLAERWRGAATEAESLVYVQWGQRIGTSIVLDGKSHRGASAAAGELGFVDLASHPDDAEDVRADDGMGPFERLVGAAAIHELATRAGAPTGPSGDLAPLFAAAADGEVRATAVVEKVAARFARGLAAIQLLLDPGLIVVGGGLSQAGDPLFDPVRRQLNRQTLSRVEVRVSALGEQAVALGGVHHGLDHVEERLLAEAEGAS